MDGNINPPGVDITPPPTEVKSLTDWSPFESHDQFHLADFLFAKAELGSAKINKLMDIWASTASKYDAAAPFSHSMELQDRIDSIDLGNVAWESFTATYQGNLPNNSHPPDWMTMQHEVWFRDPRSLTKVIISNVQFKDQFDYTPFQEFMNDKQQWTDFMSGDWAWEQAVQFFVHCFYIPNSS
jgi:Plavaka transposase